MYRLQRGPPSTSPDASWKSRGGILHLSNHCLIGHLFGAGYWDLRCANHEEVALVKPLFKGIGRSSVFLVVLLKY